MLATDLSVELTPTLVVVHETKDFVFDSTVDDLYELHEESVERTIGGQNIIDHLEATLSCTPTQWKALSECTWACTAVSPSRTRL